MNDTSYPPRLSTGETVLMQGDISDTPKSLRWIQRIILYVLILLCIAGIWAGLVYVKGAPANLALMFIGFLILLSSIVFVGMAIHPGMKSHRRWMITNYAVYMDTGLCLPIQEIARVEFGATLVTTKGKSIMLGWIPNRRQAIKQLRHDIAKAQQALVTATGSSND